MDKGTEALTPHQQKIVEQIRALRKMTRETGFRTTRTINDLLGQLDANDLGAVAVELEQQQ